MTQTVERNLAPTPGALSDLVLGTELGAWYTFPDVDMAEIIRLVQSMPISLAQLTVVNASGACLVVPVRIITYVANGDRSVVWKKAHG